MNPLGVLTARDVMQPLTGRAEGHVGPEVLIRDVMEMVRDADYPIGVRENDALIGEITKETVLGKLLDPRGRGDIA